MGQLPNKISQEDLEHLIALKDEPGFKVLLRQLEVLLSSIEEKVITSNLDDIDATKLAYLKCRAEGAKQYMYALKNYLQALTGRK